MSREEGFKCPREGRFELDKMASSDMTMWIQGRDQYGSICQRHNITGVVKYPPSKAGLGVGLHPNASQLIEFYPDSKFIADQWEEHFDVNTNKPYWYNKGVDKSTWDDPKVVAKKPPPPPSSPPPKAKKSEAQRWSRKGANGLWHNEETGETQRDMPACRIKYQK